MLPREKDAAYIWDMLDAAKTVCSFIDGVKFYQYESDRKTQLAVERAIEIIGDAARHISSEFQALHSEIPWKGIIGQRHILAHDYGEVKQERMWVVVTVHIPKLIRLLEALVPDIPNME